MARLAHTEAFYERRLKRLAPQWEAMLADDGLVAEIFSVIRFGGMNPCAQRRGDKRSALGYSNPFLQGRDSRTKLFTQEKVNG